MFSLCKKKNVLNPIYMAALHPRFKFEASFDGEIVFMGIGQSTILKSGTTVKFHKYKRGETMNTLFYSLDGGALRCLHYIDSSENLRLKSFKRYKMLYPLAYGDKGHKSKEIY
jgi:hypothetical protein